MASESVTVNVVASGRFNCDYLIDNEWDTRFVANTVLSNNSTVTVDGWRVSWAYASDNDRANGWNAQVIGNNPYTASNLPWNRVIHTE